MTDPWRFMGKEGEKQWCRHECSYRGSFGTEAPPSGPFPPSLVHTFTVLNGCSLFRGFAILRHLDQAINHRAEHRDRDRYSYILERVGLIQAAGGNQRWLESRLSEPCAHVSPSLLHYHLPVLSYTALAQSHTIHTRCSLAAVVHNLPH